MCILDHIIETVESIIQAYILMFQDLRPVGANLNQPKK